MNEEIKRLMDIYAIGELEAFVMYCKEHDIDITTVKSPKLYE